MREITLKSKDYILFTCGLKISNEGELILQFTLPNKIIGIKLETKFEKKMDTNITKRSKKVNLKEKVKEKIKDYEKKNRELLTNISDSNAENYIRLYYQKMTKIDLLKDLLR